jgi:hypothetical protein
MKHITEGHTIRYAEGVLTNLGCRNIAIEMRGSGWIAKAIVGESQHVFVGTGLTLAYALDQLAASVSEATR